LNPVKRPNEPRATHAPDARTRRARGAAELLLLGLSALGVVLVAYATSNYGPGVLQTALNGFYAAECLRDGETMQLNRGIAVFTVWPPLQPMLLALGRSAGLDYPQAGLLINLAAHFAMLYLGAKILLGPLASIWAALGCLALLLLSPDVLWSAATISFEPLFGALFVGSVYVLLRYLERPGRSYWIAAVLVMLACLQRYIGIAFVAAGVLVIASFPHSVPWRIRVRRSLGFATVALVPLALWLLRNARVGRPMLEEWPASQRGLMENTLDAWRSAMHLVGRGTETFSAGELLALLVGLTAYGLLAARAGRSRNGALAAYLCFPTLYVVFLIAIASMVTMDTINVRFIEPVVPFMLGILLLGIREAWLLLREQPVWVRGVACLPLLLPVASFLQSALVRTPNRVRTALEEGAGGMGLREWVDNPVYAWLDEHPLEGEVYSNVPEMVLVAGDRRAKLVTPATVSSALNGATQPCWLVWVDSPGGPWPALPPLLADGPPLVSVAALANGEVFRMETRLP
jgi:hypothetical protein